MIIHISHAYIYINTITYETFSLAYIFLVGPNVRCWPILNKTSLKLRVSNDVSDVMFWVLLAGPPMFCRHPVVISNSTGNQMITAHTHVKAS